MWNRSLSNLILNTLYSSKNHVSVFCKFFYLRLNQDGINPHQQPAIRQGSSEEEPSPEPRPSPSPHPQNLQVRDWEKVNSKTVFSEWVLTAQESFNP